ncbi:30S ribosomal protein S4 [Aceticella autotrophica]|uniref:Small ribosomal subunit protein uS4 n=1 Tax=Aceticella autotrophica TaxID=2755338 RepID=A0A975AVE1_9THEO|nr:30S ribosomal protein S4 [Aceticella autotrophica]QSZ27133.1 30S ribosomal protein S4 [Aceticella autotrophica]
MARYTKSTCKLCRREGIKLFLKGDKCYSDKCAMSRRAYAPGQHGQSRKKITNYGTQLREKQKLRRYYGVLERQFERYFEEAERMRGITGDNLLQLLERRLDNVVYRLSIAASRPQARQLVRHGHILVNGKKVDIPSFLVKVGDVITVKDESKSLEVIKNNIETSTNIPDWLDFNRDTIEGKILSLPAREHIDLPVEEHLIVELYSR